MSESVRVVRIGHSLHAVEDLDKARRMYLAVFGAWVFAELEYEPADWRNNLMYVGNHMLETYSPRDRSRRTDLVRYLDRFGQGYHFTHFMVESLEPVRKMLARFDLEYTGLEDWDGVLYLLSPKATRGVTLEASLIPLPQIYDPQDYSPAWRPDWASGHPSTFERNSSINLALRELAWPRRFLTQGWGGRVLLEDSVRSPEPLDRCFIALGDQVFCLCVPHEADAGPLGRYISQRGPGMYSLTWKVGNLGAFRAHLLENRQVRALQGPVELRDGICATGDFAIAPECFFGARHEFTERSYA